MMAQSQTNKLLLMLSIPLAITLSGCQENSDVQSFIAKVKQRSPAEPPPIPQISAYNPYVYPGHERNPFDPSVVAAKVKTRNGNGNDIRIDPNRVKEYLESYPLDTLRMMGTLEQGKDLWALVQTPDGTIQRVKAGNYLGQNHGKVNQVTSTEISLVEVAPDGFGGLMERPAAISLSNN